MNEKEVIKKIGKDNWKDFLRFMTGQTVGIGEGGIDYYKDDVEIFYNNIMGWKK